MVQGMISPETPPKEKYPTKTTLHRKIPQKLPLWKIILQKILSPFPYKIPPWKALPALKKWAVKEKVWQMKIMKKTRNLEYYTCSSFQSNEEFVWQLFQRKVVWNKKKIKPFTPITNTYAYFPTTNTTRKQWESCIA